MIVPSLVENIVDTTFCVPSTLDHKPLVVYENSSPSYDGFLFDKIANIIIDRRSQVSHDILGTVRVDSASPLKHLNCVI